MDILVPELGLGGFQLIWLRYEWLMRASEGLALKKSGAELPCLDLNLSLERILFAAAL